MQIIPQHAILDDRSRSSRDTFVIDMNGIVRMIYRKVSNPAKHPQEVLTYVQENLAGK